MASGALTEPSRLSLLPPCVLDGPVGRRLQLADVVVEGLREERFLILPHAEVLEYMRRKTGDYDRWLGGMRRMRGKYEKV